VQAGQAQRGQADKHSHDCGHEPDRQEQEREGQCERLVEAQRRPPADRENGDLPHGDEAHSAVEDAQPQRHDGVHDRGGEDLEPVAPDDGR
jgi:hypothetical protein